MEARLAMKHNVLKIHPDDNVLVALKDLKEGEEIRYNGSSFSLTDDVPAKHKFITQTLHKDDVITIYGITVGKALDDIPKGTRISTENTVHATSVFNKPEKKQIGLHLV